MMRKNLNSNQSDRIDGDTIILYDTSKKGPKTLKRVEIKTLSGETKHYEIKKTRKGGYLFN